MPLILDGKKINSEIRQDLSTRIAINLADGFAKPCLAIIQIGNTKESTKYIEHKKKFGHTIGAEVLHIHLPDTVSDSEVLKEISSLNTDDSVHGIIIQLPLPKHIDRDVLVEAVISSKDVDGLTSENIRGLWTNDKGYILPATARAILTMLDYYDIQVSGKKVVVVGRSTLVGKPTAMALINKGATVTVCHSGTVKLADHTLEADIIISAVGFPRLIDEHCVRPHQVIIDVGTTFIKDEEVEKITGDVDYNAVSQIVAAISPVPGGVGPLTVSSLFQNVYDAYLKKIGK
ncbi:MAG: bifunctional 5,10-methylenetetrahydrofolate dehydrogenase/5,10-methenyltetrahydrofolate cyclohydrolase [Candidatus Pacebacteria bacterium]|nr:bifunctional 5,10-methylenetetrahydrofolate dehydrogenase/5,10-methenyltetrahydrofolate cyclohydrolase [Candidatus Paceibacterota bacterium]